MKEGELRMELTPKVHLLETRGEVACGAIDVGGLAEADINSVTCAVCIDAHDKDMEKGQS